MPGNDAAATPVAMIVGCGDVGGQLALRLLQQGWTVYGMRRSVARLPDGVRALAGDVTRDERPADWPDTAVDYLVYAVAAGRGDEAGYREAYANGLRRVLGWLRASAQRPRRLLFVSSTGVYGQSAGEWVDESSPTLPEGYRGRIMLEAEQVALTSGFPATWVRLAGIYGPGREHLWRQVCGGAEIAPGQAGCFTNRIHRDDAADLLALLLLRAEQGEGLAEGYLGVDDQPCTLQEVVEGLRSLCPAADEHVQGAAAVITRSGSKRCSNARARALGWQPRYPGFMSGYRAMLGAAE